MKRLLVVYLEIFKNKLVKDKGSRIMKTAHHRDMTDISSNFFAGILGVGYEDGCVYLLPLQWEADSLKSQTFLTGSTVIESEADNMSVSCMTWMQCDEV